MVQGASGPEVNMAVVRRFYDEVFNDGHVEVLDEIISADYVDYGHNPPGRGPQGARDDYDGVMSAFGDAHYRISDIVAAGDTVAARWSGELTHTGPFAGVEPTGRRVHLSGMSFYKLADGQITETRNVADVMSFLQELGALPG